MRIDTHLPQTGSTTSKGQNPYEMDVEIRMNHPKAHKGPTPTGGDYSCGNCSTERGCHYSCNECSTARGC